MGKQMTKLGESKVYKTGQIQLIANALPFLDNPKPGDYIEYHFFPEKPDEIVLRKKKDIRENV